MTRRDPFEPTLDPEDWEQFRMLAREMVDTTVDDLKGLPTRHAWRPLSEQDKVPFANLWIVWRRQGDSNLCYAADWPKYWPPCRTSAGMRTLRGPQDKHRSWACTSSTRT
jgi:hypothetical protein